MDTKRVIVGCLFFDLHIGIGGGGLLESHAGFILLGQLQIGKSHMQISILRQGIINGGYFSQCFGGLGVYAYLKIGESQHVESVPAGRSVAFKIAFECFDGFLIFTEMIRSVSQNTVHFGGMFVLRISRQVILRYYFRFVVVFLDDVNLGYVIRYQCFVFRVVLQRQKSRKGLVVTFLSITDV